MKYPYRRSYRGSALRIDIRADRKFFITMLGRYLSFSACPKQCKSSIKVVFYLSAQKQAPVNDGSGMISFNDHCSIDVNKREIRILVSQKYSNRRKMDHNDILVRPLSCLLNSLGYYAIHASSVYKNETFVVFSGPGGRGKSTLSCVLSLRGFKHLCDDMVFIGERKNGIELVPLKTRVKIDNQERKSFIDVKSIDTDDMPALSRHKKLFFIFPKYTGDLRPKLKPISRKEGIVRLISDNMVLETGQPDNRTAKISNLDFICRLGNKTPFFEIYYNDRNLLESGQMIEKLIVRSKY